MTDLYTLLKERLDAWWRGVWGEAGGLPMLRPVGPYAGPEMLSPFAAIGALIGLAITAGISLAALGALLLSLLALRFLLTEVLGITVEIQPFPV